jgi:hypothetical protein
MAKTMVAGVACRKYWREADARVMLEAWHDSGATLSAFARRHRIDSRRLARWSARLSAGTPPAVRFHPVRLTDAAGNRRGGDVIEIELRSGHRVRVAQGFQLDDLRRVVEALEGRGC